MGKDQVNSHSEFLVLFKIEEKLVICLKLYPLRLWTSVRWQDNCCSQTNQPQQQHHGLCSTCLTPNASSAALIVGSISSAHEELGFNMKSITEQQLSS